MIVLIGPALLAGVIGEASDTIAIVATLLLNAGLGFTQEYGAEQAVAALRELAAPRARVRRDGAWSIMAASELVLGDVVRLEAGDIVPADLCLTFTAQLRIAGQGLRGVQRLLVGSVADKLIRSAAVPVLVVPAHAG